MRNIPEAEDCFLEPGYELQAYLIKPVQRICKYPLILEQLIKRSPPSASNLAELKDGLASIKTVTDRVNEAQRVMENVPVVKGLETSVEDWKGHNVHTFGGLYYHDKFMVFKGDSEREYRVYVFEKIILCCKEIPAAGQSSKKSSKASKQALHASTGSSPGSKARAGGKKATYQLKGRIFINNVISCVPMNTKSNMLMGLGSWSLQVVWRSDSENESFVLQCRSEEQLRSWCALINRLMDDVAARRQQLQMTQMLHASGSAGPARSATPASGAGRRGLPTSTSTPLFPSTPVTEHIGYFPLVPSSSAADGPSEDTPADQVEGLRHEAVSSPNFFSRSTPLGNYGRMTPTEMAPLNLPPSATPPLRGPRRQRSNTAEDSPAFAHPLSARGHATMPARPIGSQLPPVPPVSSSPRPWSHGAPRTRPSEEPAPMPFSLANTAGSRAGMVGPAAPSPFAPPPHDEGHLRSRSTSNPQFFHLPGPMQSYGRGSGTGPSASGTGQHARVPSQPHAAAAFAGRAVHLSGASASASAPAPAPVGGTTMSRTTTAPPTPNLAGGLSSPPLTDSAARPRPVSGSTFDSIRSSGHSDAQPSMSLSSSLMDWGTSPSGWGDPTPTPPASAGGGRVIRVVLQYGSEEDTLVQVVLATIGFGDLYAKVTEKVRMCIGPQAVPDTGLRLKYIDEDGDLVAMNNDEDVSLAFDAARANQNQLEIVCGA